MAHILPESIYRKTMECNRVAFWHALELCFPEAKVRSWIEEALTMYHTPANLFCLSPTAHLLWESGAFALKPISQDGFTLTVRFVWQVESLDTPSQEQMSLLTHPPSTRNLHGPAGSRLAHSNSNTTYIASGDEFVFRTTDPKRMPLPSFKLLELQWFVHRVLALAGPAVEEKFCYRGCEEEDYEYYTSEDDCDEED